MTNTTTNDPNVSAAYEAMLERIEDTAGGAFLLSIAAAVESNPESFSGPVEVKRVYEACAFAGFEVTVGAKKFDVKVTEMMR